MATTSLPLRTSSPAGDTKSLTALSACDPLQASPVLILYSHGRTPPLNPPPDLKFDLRSIPNPPKSSRDAHDGRSKRLRAHLLADSKFLRKLQEVKGKIEEAMQGKMETETNGIDNRKGTYESVQDREADEEDEEVEENYLPDGVHDAAVLRVGCNCALGHHRSVAFVEELARLEWPREWRVEVHHRDVDEKRAAGTRARQKGQWRSIKQGSRRVDNDEED